VSASRISPGNCVMPLRSLGLRSAGLPFRRWFSHKVFRDLFAAQIVSASAALLVNVMSARGMGPDGRGALALYLQLSYVVSAVCLAGLDRALPAVNYRGMSLPVAEGQILRLLLPSGLLTILALACWIAPGFWGDPSAVDLSLLAGAFGLALWGNVGMLAMRASAIAAQETVRFLLVMMTGQALLVVGASVLLAFAVEAPSAWLTLYGLALLGPVAVALFKRRPALSGNARQGIKVRRLGLKLAPTVVANMVMLRSDRLLLPLLGSVEQLGLYIVVAAITELIGWPVQTFVDGRIPGWRSALERGGLRVGRLLVAVGVYAVVGVLGVSFLLRLSLTAVFGQEYAQSLVLVLPLAAAAGLYAFSRVGMGLTIASDRASLAAAIDVCGMAVAAAAYLLLIPSAGAAGAAIGSLLGYGVAAAISAAAAIWVSRSTIGGVAGGPGARLAADC
jgi:O-antigen/teichoic acid export membrane protein